MDLDNFEMTMWPSAVGHVGVLLRPGNAPLRAHAHSSCTRSGSAGRQLKSQQGKLPMLCSLRRIHHRPIVTTDAGNSKHVVSQSEDGGSSDYNMDEGGNSLFSSHPQWHRYSWSWKDARCRQSNRFCARRTIIYDTLNPTDRLQSSLW